MTEYIDNNFFMLGFFLSLISSFVFFYMAGEEGGISCLFLQQ